MKFFINCKHWVIFSGAFVIPAILVLFGYYHFKFHLNISLFFYMIPLGIAVSQMFVYGWLWAVGGKLAKIVPADSSKDAAFKGLITVPFFMLVAFLVFWAIVPFAFPLSLPSSATLIYLFSTTAIFLQAFFILSFFYCFNFLANLMKRHDMMGEYVFFKEYIKEFILVELLPIGIWFIQPRITKMINEPQDWY